MRTRTLATLVACTLGAGLHASIANGQVTHFPADRTTAAFAKGEPLIETPTYKVHASRREAPGQAEIHEADTDIFYVLDGTATVVTGGRIVDAQTVSPGELRGKTIEGGTVQRLAKGDVFIVPNGVAHQFTEVSGPFLYYTVKVTAARGGGGQP